MKKLFLTTATLLALATPAFADFSDKYFCTKLDIETELAALIAGNAGGTALGIRLIYVKGDPVEVSRKPNELRCRVVAVTSQGNVTGIFNFKSEDGHSLVGFAPGKSK
jgi:hypothetical protein